MNVAGAFVAHLKSMQDLVKKLGFSESQTNERCSLLQDARRKYDEAAELTKKHMEIF